MELGVALPARPDLPTLIDEVRCYDRLGVDTVSVPESYGGDAISLLGYLAAVTERVGLASAIIPVHSRTASLIAMSAAGLDRLSKGRAELGLGTSGPQVIEGFHGVPFRRQLSRVRDTVEICRSLWRGESARYSGRSLSVPFTSVSGSGSARAMRLMDLPPRAAIPIAVAALTPRAVEQAAEIADLWIPLFVLPEKFAERWGPALLSGLARRADTLPDLGIVAQAALFVGSDDASAMGHQRRRLAMFIGAMGPLTTNFYAQLIASYGFKQEVARIQRLYSAGDVARARAEVPDELVRMTSLIGTERAILQRVERYRAVGVTRISVMPIAERPGERVEHVRAFKSLISE